MHWFWLDWLHLHETCTPGSYSPNSLCQWSVRSVSHFVLFPSSFIFSWEWLSYYCCMLTSDVFWAKIVKHLAGQICFNYIATVWVLKSKWRDSTFYKNFKYWKHLKCMTLILFKDPLLSLLIIWSLEHICLVSRVTFSFLKTRNTRWCGPRGKVLQRFKTKQKTKFDQWLKLPGWEIMKEDSWCPILDFLKHLIIYCWWEITILYNSYEWYS